MQGHRINALRLPPYHRLDLRFNLVSFFTVLNVYDRANLYHRFWDSDDNRTGRVYQWSRIPVGGFELEF